MQRLDVQSMFGGWWLPRRLRAQMEILLDADLSGVRLQLSLEPLAWGAVACTQGSTVFFCPGSYCPTSRAGRMLIAHELTHVVQQRSGRVRRPDSGPVVDDTQLEREALDMGARAASLPRLPHEVPAVCTGSHLSLSCASPIQRQVIWAAKKSKEYGFQAELDQLEVDETVQTLVLRGHGPSVDYLDANYQLTTGTSKYIYVVGHSAGTFVSGYSADEVFKQFTGKGLQDGMKFKIMACNAGMINGFVMAFRQKLAQYPHVEVKGVDRIICYTKETKFLYTHHPEIDTTQYDEKTLQTEADNGLSAKVWEAVHAEVLRNSAFLESLSAFYERFGVKTQKVKQSIQNAHKNDGASVKTLLEQMKTYIDNYASPKLAYDLRGAIKEMPGLIECKARIEQAFQEFRQSTGEGWKKKKDWLRKHHHLDVEEMSGPGRLKRIHDKGDTSKALHPYINH